MYVYHFMCEFIKYVHPHRVSAHGSNKNELLTVSSINDNC